VPERPPPRGYSLAVVTEADLDDLLPLMRACCDFYETVPVRARAVYERVGGVRESWVVYTLPVAGSNA
jgi:hypothetical protein